MPKTDDEHADLIIARLFVLTIAENPLGNILVNQFISTCRLSKQARGR